MTEILNKIKDILGVIRYILPAVGIGGAGTSISLGGARVFEGFAGRYSIDVLWTHDFDRNALRPWGLEIIMEPMAQLSTHPLWLCVIAIGLISISYVLIQHLLFRNGSRERDNLYNKYHHLVTLLIYLLLSILIFVPYHIYLFLLALMVFLVFSTVHLYFGARDFRERSQKEKTVYALQIVLVIFIVLFLPFIYGNYYFSPKVWCLAANPSEKSIIVNKTTRVAFIFFSDPSVSTEVVVGKLYEAKGKGQHRNLTMILQKDNIEQRSRGRMPSKASENMRVPEPLFLMDLLEMKFEAQVKTAQNLDLSKENERIDSKVKELSLSENGIGIGYPDPE
jgi:hypothetical protein